MDIDSRAATAFHFTPTEPGRAGETIQLVISRANRSLRVPYLLRHTDTWTTFSAQIAFKLILFCIAFILLWRGKDSASVLLGLWCTSVGLSLPDAWWGALPVQGRIAGGALSALLWTASPVLLYFVVEAIAKGVSKRTRLITRLLMAALFAPSFIVGVLDATTQAIGGCAVVAISPFIVSTSFASVQLVIIGFFGVSYARTTGLDKQRLRWVFWAFVLSRAGVLINLLNRLLVHPVQLSGLEWVTVLIFPIGCTYAILRHRIIDVNFVLNRTLVYTILTSLVVGIFILLEDLLKVAEASRGVGIAVELAVALGIGFSLNGAHKYIERTIERWLFKAKHEAVGVLRRVIEEAPFMESAEALSSRCISDVCRATGACGATLYERVDDAYVLSSDRDGSTGAEVIPIDDLAFVRMRRTHAPVHLSEVQSALGNDGIAFPCSVRGAVTGALVCRNRPNGEAFAPDEIALLASVAHEVGAEIQAIRSRRHSELLDALLAGRLEIREARMRLRTP